MRAATAVTIAAGAAIALAAWAASLPGPAPAQPVRTAAPVNRDYLQRNAVVAFEERELRRNPRDQITSRMLAAQYLQRFREQGDPADVLRAQAMARRSLQLQPQGNTAAQSALASALLAVHDFRGAIVHERAAIESEAFDQPAHAQLASLLMETGRYDESARILALRPATPENPAWDAVEARYQELTGHLRGARITILRAGQTMDSFQFAGAYDRSWYHVRSGQLAFEAGDFAAAEREYRRALELFPYNTTALLWEAKLFRAQRRWREALTAAARSADLYPLPQALGYEADAQRALGLASQARQTDELIRAEQKLFNASGINDRLLATYFVQRRIHLDDALRAARSDYLRRGDEIYADDTMAWTLAALGRWTSARAYSLRAVRLGTEDPQIEFHAGEIALHLGLRAEARSRLQRALQLNPRFDPIDAPRAAADLRR